MTSIPAICPTDEFASSRRVTLASHPMPASARRTFMLQTPMAATSTASPPSASVPILRPSIRGRARSSTRAGGARQRAARLRARNGEIPDGRETPPGSPGYGGASAGGDPFGILATAPEPVRGLEDKEFLGLNTWFLARINPDGTDMRMFSGFRLDREATQAYRPSFHRPGSSRCDIHSADANHRIPARRRSASVPRRTATPRDSRWTADLQRIALPEPRRDS